MTVDELVKEIRSIQEEIGIREHNIILDEVVKRLESLRESLRHEVSRIEKLQPLATSIFKAVEEYRKPTT
jgi:hypothetical protein